MTFKFDRYELGYRLLVAYIYILLFGSWILKMISISDSVGLMVLLVLDIVPLGIWVFSNPSFRIKSKDFFVDTLSFWICWALVLILLFVTSYAHGGSLIPSVVHWGAIVRYIPLAYIVVSLSKHIDIGDRLIRQLKVISGILLSVAYISILLGEKATIFLPLLPVGATAEREMMNGCYAGVFANTIDQAFILLLLYVIFIYGIQLSIKKKWFLSLLFFIPVFKTGSAIATFIFVIIAVYRLTQNDKVIRYALITCSAIAIILLLYTYWDLVMLVIENIKLSRLGILTNTLPDFLTEMSVDTVFGIGNDGYVVLDKVNSYKEQVYLLKVATDGNIGAFGDVYWVALLVFHGLLGLGIIVFIYYKLFKATTSKCYLDSRFDYNRIIKWFYFSIVILAFLNQVIVVKTFALFFWIFLAITYTKISPNESFANK